MAGDENEIIYSYVYDQGPAPKIMQGNHLG